MVGFNIVVAVVLGFLALLCAIASLSLRRNVPLAWVAAALASGTVQTLMLTFAAGSAMDFVSAALLGPVGYLLAGQSIHSLAPHMPWRPQLIGTVAALIALATVLHLSGAPIIVQALAFELACSFSMGDATVRIISQKRRRPFDLGLIAAVALLWAATTIRLLALWSYGSTETIAAFSQSGAETIYLAVSSLLTPIIITLLLARIINDTIATFQHQSEHDGLTGLLNRRAFDAVSTATSAQGSVIFCDLDHFKQVNDRYGHQVGDDVIRAFAVLIGQAGHITGRVGGEEFALLLPGTKLAEAIAIAETLRADFHDTPLAGLAAGHRLSASFGVADYAGAVSAQTALVRADAALYAAKAAGRNCVMPFNSFVPSAETRSQRAA